VAWRTVKAIEFPVQPRADTIEAKGNAPLGQDRVIQIEKRFTAILTSLIVSSEAAPSPWREAGEQYFKSALGLRRRSGHQSEGT
jgi:hypothetical protein